MLVIIEEIGEILKWRVDRIMVEMIINYQNNRQGNQWFESRNRFQNDDRRFNDRGYREIEVKMTILREGTKEIGVRVKILDEAVGSKWDD
ncbi:hypothetical protein TNCV_3467291 [Trichonephila clavipes]|nr:hypothetical protein TNCV_3467291 [Trichonephila clavipes]